MAAAQSSRQFSCATFNKNVCALDESFFHVRFNRLTPAEKRYLRAMAELGAGPHRSGEIADVLGRRVTSLGPTRSQLIAKGMVWSPNHGDTAFTQARLVTVGWSGTEQIESPLVLLRAVRSSRPARKAPRASSRAGSRVGFVRRADDEAGRGCIDAGFRRPASGGGQTL